MTWILLIAIGGFTGVTDVHAVNMTEAQCKAAVVTLLPLQNAIGAACVGPNGERYEFADVPPLTSE